MQNKKDELAELRELFFRYAKEWKWFVLSVVCCLGVAAVYLTLKSPVYQVKANVLIKGADASNGLKGTAKIKEIGFGFPGSMDVQDELYVLSSYSLMRQVIDSLDLTVNYTETKWGLKKIDRFEDSVIKLTVPKGVTDTLEAYLSFDVDIKSDGLVNVKVKDEKDVLVKMKNKSLPLLIDTKYGQFNLDFTGLYKKGKSYDYVVDLQGLNSLAESYMEEIVIELADKKANVITLETKSANIAKSKAILNTIIGYYNIDALNEKNILATNTSKFIMDRLVHLSDELINAETVVEQFKKKNKILDMGLESKTMLESNAEIQKRLVFINTQITIIEQLIDYLQKPENRYELLPTSVGIDDVTAKTTVADYNRLLLERMRMLQTTFSKNPALNSLEAQIDALRTTVLLSLKNLQGSQEIAKADLERQVNIYEQRYTTAPTIEKGFRDIMRNQIIKESLVMYLMEKREENALTLAVNTPKAKIIDSAFKSKKPVAPRKMFVLGIALLMGLLIPVIVLYLRSILVTTFSSKNELEAITTIPVLGEICTSDNKEHIAVSKNTTTPVAELFRLLRSNLQFVLTRKDQKVILLTSTQSGEGKSFLSVNLAVSLGLMNKKVVLVGLDIRSPKLAEYIDISAKKGVTNFLSDQTVKVEDIINYNVQGQNIDVIISGPVPPNPSELLLSDRLDELFNSLKEQYDYVLIDSAPIGMVSDTLSLTRFADITLYVIRANYSNKNNVSFVESLIQQDRLEKVYLVVNGTKETDSYRYGYGYGYGKK